MTTEQRLNRLEDEFSTVKELLMSAARYAESANAKLDRLAERGERTQTHLDQLAEKVDSLTDAQERTQGQLDQLSERVDSFVFEAQRLFNQQAQRLNRLEGHTESLSAVVQMLNRTHQASQSQLQELQRATQEFQRASLEYQRSNTAAIERIDRVLDYLLRQDPGDSPPSEI
ncbi:MAG: 6-aminohexanoate hydrolase [Merismopedia sp. SIO2A8]|nr:6-aminohexanoate hydrolase [Symploca sp. SIO2B6]NET47361.1 6-aminohexanoate hydrolase [Merismopedia sp. SIO2A8]